MKTVSMLLHAPRLAKGGWKRGGMKALNVLSSVSVFGVTKNSEDSVDVIRHPLEFQGVVVVKVVK